MKKQKENTRQVLFLYIYELIKELIHSHMKREYVWRIWNYSQKWISLV